MNAQSEEQEKLNNFEDEVNKMIEKDEGDNIPPSAGIPEVPRDTAKEIPYNWDEIGELADLISSKVDEITEDTEEIAVSINGIRDTLRVGDTTTVDGKVVRILGFNHDELSDTEKETAYGGGRTYAGISFEYVDLITSAKMNTTSTSAGGWGASELRGILNNTTINSISIKDRIKEVKKEYIQTYNNAGSKTTSNDKLWLLSCGEIWNNGYGGGVTRGYAIATEGKQYKYYKKINATWNTTNNALKKPSNVAETESNGTLWWLRSPDCNRSDRFCYVYTARSLF